MRWMRTLHAVTSRRQFEGAVMRDHRSPAEVIRELRLPRPERDAARAEPSARCAASATTRSRPRGAPPSSKRTRRQQNQFPSGFVGGGVGGG